MSKVVFNPFSGDLLLLPAEEGGGDTTIVGLLPYTHTQSVPSASWIIVHGRGRRPHVTLVVGDRQEYTDIEYPDLNTVTVVWPTPTVGYAELI